MLALHDWQNFYMLTGTAAATLIGLLFVAISISAGANLSLQQATNSLRTFVDPTLLYYVQALLVSCLTVMPLTSSFILGVVLMVQGSIDIVLTIKVCWRIVVLHRDDAIDLGHWVWHIALPLLTGILYVCIAIGLFIGWQIALVGLSIAVLLCLSIGLHNTWILTIWLILHREAFQQTPDEQQPTKKKQFIGDGGCHKRMTPSLHVVATQLVALSSALYPLHRVLFRTRENIKQESHRQGGECG